MNRVFIHRYKNDGKAGVFWDPQKNKWHGQIHILHVINSDLQ